MNVYAETWSELGDFDLVYLVEVTNELLIMQKYSSTLENGKAPSMMESRGSFHDGLPFRSPPRDFRVHATLYFTGGDSDTDLTSLLTTPPSPLILHTSNQESGALILSTLGIRYHTRKSHPSWRSTSRRRCLGEVGLIYLGQIRSGRVPQAHLKTHHLVSASFSTSIYQETSGCCEQGVRGSEHHRTVRN